ncbi:MAG: DUF6797 domain-containing protein [Pirellulaceae bacterium]
MTALISPRQQTPIDSTSAYSCVAFDWKRFDFAVIAARFVLGISVVFAGAILRAQETRQNDGAIENVSGQGGLAARLIKRDLSELVSEALKNGDPSQGAILFHQPQVQCSVCHVAGVGVSPLGPNLVEWETPPKPEYLLESILMPSKAIRPGYETLQILTDDGAFSGIVAEKSEYAIAIRDATNPSQPIVFEREDIVELKESKLSSMPDSLVDQLQSEQEFLDLAAYVLTVAERGADYAASIQPSPAMTALAPLPEYEARVDHAGLIASLDAEAFERGQKIYRRVCANCHGTHDEAGSLPTSPRFATGKLKKGHDPYAMYQTLTHGAGLMVAQRWMVPQQKYDVVHYIREAYFKGNNEALYSTIDQAYLASLPEGDTKGPEPSRYEPYVAMDYGPSLMNTYEIEFNNDGENIGRDLGKNPRSKNPWANPDDYFEKGEAPNYAYKGIAVRLDRGAGGVTRGRHWVVYDHDTMSMNAAWSGDGFIDYCCIQFDGQHNTHNRLVGELLTENPVGPGWAQPLTGVWDDPRPVGRDGRAYGPLPKAWLEYRGLYHHGLQTILSYRVGGAEVLEMPSVVEGEQPVFVRDFTLGPAEHELVLRLGSNDVQFALSQSDFAEIETNADEATLVITPRSETVHLQVLFGRDLEAGRLESLVEDAEPTNLNLLTLGGARRWPQKVTTTITTTFDEEFSVDQLTLPSSNPWNAQVRATGIDFYRDANKAAVCTWDGDVWLVEGLEQDSGTLQWQRIASGLFQPLGIRLVDEQIFVTCRDQLVVLRDLNGDLETDYYECFNNDHQVTEHFHEFAMGLQTDDEGNFYYAKSGRHAKRAVVPHHGTLLKVAADGSDTEILATGFRAANGVCINPDGSFFVTDQEGHWNPKNRINWVQSGGFYGNMYSFTDVLDSSDSAMEQPLCWITNAFDRSPAELLWVPEGTWGPFSGSLLNLSYGYGKVFLVPHEKVRGQLQGGMIQLPIPDAASGLIRGRFHPTRPELYACGMFSWAGSRQAPGCFYRIRYNDKPVHLPVELNARQGELEIEYSHTLDLSAVTRSGAFVVRAWDLKRTPNYGSQHFNERELKVTSASLGADGKTVLLSLPDLEPTWGMSIQYELIGANGRSFQGELHNSIHNLGDAESSE